MLNRFMSAGAGFVVAWLALLGGVLAPHAAAAEDIHVDDANHFEARIPAGWYEIQPSLLKAVSDDVASRVPWQNFRYVAGYSTSPQGDLTFPYVLIQVTDAPMNQVTEADLVRGFEAKGFADDVLRAAPSISELMSDVTLSATWDASRRRMIMPMTADLAGVGPIRGLMVAQVGSHGMVQVNCYALASEFAATLPVFQEWVEGVHIEPGYEWQPGSEPSLDAGAVGAAAVMGVLGALVVAVVILAAAVVIGALIYARSRRRRSRFASAPGMLQPASPGPSKRWGSHARPLVDLNAASAEELAAELGLPGEWAAAIVETRASLGLYRHPEQLYSRVGLPYDLYVAVVGRVMVGAGQPAPRRHAVDL